MGFYTYVWLRYDAAGDKIAQMIPIPVLTGEGVMEIEAFTEEITMRGANGFGSTGR
jgi:dUTPase